MKNNSNTGCGRFTMSGRGMRLLMALALFIGGAAGAVYGQAPVFTTQPSSPTVTAGATATFGPVAVSVASVGTTFQWQVSTNGGVIFSNLTTSASFTGVATATLSALATNSTENGWLFRALAVNTTGTTASNNATLTVNFAPAFTTQPASTAVVQGSGNATFGPVAVTGNPAPTFQWQVSTNGGTSFSNVANGASFANVTTATLTVISPLVAQNGNLFRCVATNSVAPAGVNSSNATLTVTVAPAITTQPGNVTLTSSGTATFTGAATGTPAPTFQWQVSTNNGGTWSNLTNTSPYSGVTTTTLTVTNVTAAQSGDLFRMLAINSGTTTASNGGSLAVNSAPVITLSPLSRTKLVGTTTTFTGAATGNPTPSLQWQFSTNGGTSWSNTTDGGNISGSTTSSLTIINLDQTKSGNEYQLLAYNFLGTVNSTVAVLTVQTPPSISTEPANLTVTAGSAANFTVVASGNPAVTYQWQVSVNNGFSFGNLTDGGNVTGSATANLTIANVAAFVNGHQYQCVVSNAGGSVTSSVAVLTVDFTPGFSTQPANVTVLPGAAANFTVVATGNPAPALQWQVSTNGGVSYTNVVNGGNISGNTSATLSISAAGAGLSGDLFQCVATNTVATVTSTAALLTVNTPASITTQPMGALVNGLTNVILSVVASGTSPLSYQWFLNGVAIPGQQSSTLTLLSVTGNNSGNYTVSVTNSGGNVTSGIANLTVYMAPKLTSTVVLNPLNPQTRGNAVMMMISALGVQPLQYQWLKNGRKIVNSGRISGATSAKLSMARVSLADVGQYSVVVTNPLGQVTSGAVPLNVN